jgi:hypothetical protein
MNKFPKDVQRIIGYYLHRDKIDKLLHPELVVVTRNVYELLNYNFPISKCYRCYKCYRCLHWGITSINFIKLAGREINCGRCVFRKIASYPQN